MKKAPESVNCGRMKKHSLHNRIHPLNDSTGDWKKKQADADTDRQNSASEQILTDSG